MPFQGVFSGADLTRIRGGVESAVGYVAVHSPSAIVQFNPSANNTANEAAEITYSTVLSGDGTDTLLGMTVIISPSSDWEGDLRDHFDDCLVTYVRVIGSGASSGTLGIGKTAYQWTTGDFVTVIDDFRVHKREIRVVGTSIFHDWDRAITTPLPRIYNLEADVVVIAGASTTYNPTPSASAMISGGTISTWSWSKIMSGVVTKAVSSSQNPSITLNTGWNWLHLTVTDSAGESNYLVVPVLIINADFSQSVILTGLTNLGGQRSLENGNSADFDTNTDKSLLPGTNALVIHQVDYVDGTSETTIACVGWLSEITAQTQGDLAAGVLRTATYQIVGITQKMGEHKITARFVQEKTSPATWNELARVTLFDAAWVALSEYSTVPNVAALTVGNTFTDFRFSTLDIPEGSLLDTMLALLERSSGTAVAWTPDGTIYVDTSLIYETSAANRNAADVIASFAVNDGSIVDMDAPEGLAVEQVELGCGVYLGTNENPRIYRALAPADFTAGALREPVDGVLLVAGSSDVSSRQQAGQLAANHWSASNASPSLSLSLKAGYHVLAPVSHQWFKFIFDNLISGHIFDTDDRFLLLEISLEYDTQEGTIRPQATLRKETNGGDKYASLVEYVTISTNTTEEYIPSSLYPGATTPDDLYTDAPCWQALDLPPELAEQLRLCAPDSEILHVPLYANTAVPMANNTVNLETYLVDVEGFTTEDAGNPTVDFDGGYAYTVGFVNTWGDGEVSINDTGSGNPGNAAEHHHDINPINAGNKANKYTYVEIDLGSSQSIAGINFDAFEPSGSGGTNPFVYFYLDGVEQGLLRFATTQDAWQARSFGAGLFPVSGQVIRLRLVTVSVTALDRVMRMDNIVIDIGGGSGENIIDAFYRFNQDTGIATQYASGDGLQIDGADFSTIPVYAPDHRYAIEETGTGSPFSFRFDDSDYSNNGQHKLRVTTIGSGL